jgi:hypothetical protein
VDVWDEERDARLYAGPWPVVAHPPCAAWCALSGLRQALYGYPVGEDGGCFEAALHAVRTYGGVLEHPAYSKAWKAHGLPRPATRGGWTTTFDDPGASCYVEQGAYGLPVRKATWLYAVADHVPALRWRATLRNPDPAAGWWVFGAKRTGQSRARDARASATPSEFRDELLAIARHLSARQRPPERP